MAGRIFYLESQKISQHRCDGSEFEYTSVMIKTAVHWFRFNVGKNQKSVLWHGTALWISLSLLVRGVSESMSNAMVINEVFTGLNYGLKWGDWNGICFGAFGDQRFRNHRSSKFVLSTRGAALMSLAPIEAGARINWRITFVTHRTLLVWIRSILWCLGCSTWVAWKASFIQGYLPYDPLNMCKTHYGSSVLF